MNTLRHLPGQAHYLAAHKQSSGQVQLTDAVAYWWILKDEAALGSNSSYIESSGHVAAIFKDELYEISNGRSGHAKLQQFGVIFGQKQVVIYVEPTANQKRRVTTNTARTQLMVNAERLPWTDWSAEFRERIPDEIYVLMDEIASKTSGSDHSKSIKERLKALMDLYKVSRYKPSPNGALRIGDPQPTAGGRAPSSGGGSGARGGGGGGNPKSGPVGGVYSAFLKNDGTSGIQVRPDMFPEVKWVSVNNGSRDQYDIEDKAARYLPEQHILLINADFRVFADMIQHWALRDVKEHGDTAGLRDVVRDSVHDWYVQCRRNRDWCSGTQGQP